MPSAPSRICGRNGCQGLVQGSACSRCGSRRQTGWKYGKERGTRQAVGYDAAWYRLRAAAIERHRQENGGLVICEFCGRPIVDEPIHADHRIPFAALDDPLRLDPTNIRLAHGSCHMSATARHANRRG